MKWIVSVFFVVAFTVSAKAQMRLPSPPMYPPERPTIRTVNPPPIVTTTRSYNGAVPHQSKRSIMKAIDPVEKAQMDFCATGCVCGCQEGGVCRCGMKKSQIKMEQIPQPQQQQFVPVQQYVPDPILNQIQMYQQPVSIFSRGFSSYAPAPSNGKNC